MTVSNRLDIPSAIVGILDRHQQVVGTGFFTDDEWLITCAHLVELILGSLPGGNRIVFARTQQANDSASIDIRHSDGRITKGYMHIIDKSNDVAILSTFPVTDILKLEKNAFSREGLFETYIFPSPNNSIGAQIRGEILGTVLDKDGKRWIELKSEDIRGGGTGAPVIDVKTKSVLGMISARLSDTKKENTTYFAIPVDTISNLLIELTQPNNTARQENARVPAGTNQPVSNGTNKDQQQELALINSIENNPNNLEYYLTLSRQYEKQGNLSQAEKILRDAINANPTNTNGYRGLGRILERQNKYAEAYDVYQKCIETDPNDGRSLQSMGILLGKRGDFEGSITYFHRALNLRPNDARLYRDLGDIHEKKGDLSKAIESTLQAISLRPTDASFYRDLGRLYEKQNNTDDAITAYRKSYELIPDSWTNRRLDELSKSKGKNNATSSDNSIANTSELPLIEPAIDEPLLQQDDISDPNIDDTSREDIIEDNSTSEQKNIPVEPIESISLHKIQDSVLEKHAATDKPIQNVKQDKLGFGDYVTALHDFIASQYTTTPLTISVDGPWGAGKSSLMYMLKNSLEPKNNIWIHNGVCVKTILGITDWVSEKSSVGYITFAASAKNKGNMAINKYIIAPKYVELTAAFSLRAELAR